MDTDKIRVKYSREGTAQLIERLERGAIPEDEKSIVYTVLERRFKISKVNRIDHPLSYSIDQLQTIMKKAALQEKLERRFKRQTAELKSSK